MDVTSSDALIKVKIYCFLFSPRFVQLPTFILSPLYFSRMLVEKYPYLSVVPFLSILNASYTTPFNNKMQEFLLICLLQNV